MAEANRRKPKLYEIEWLDANIGTQHDVINFTVGYLVRNDAKGVRVSPEWCGNPDVDEHDPDLTTFVPWGMVRAVRLLGSKRRLEIPKK